LRPWGTARVRVVRLEGVPDLAVRPRRARCSNCQVTHVLLPDWLFLRRAYAAPVIWEALAAHARGLGYRRISLLLGLPETTVRDWLRTFKRSGARRLSGLIGPGHASASAVFALERRATTTQAWRLAVRATQGGLLVNTNPPHLADQTLSVRSR
jgi:hypothetical protein